MPTPPPPSIIHNIQHPFRPINPHRHSCIKSTCNANITPPTPRYSSRSCHKALIESTMQEAPVEVKDAFVLSSYEASGLPGIKSLFEEWGVQLLNHVHTQYGKTALILASMRNNLETVQLLLEYGATVDFVDSYGWTALREAAYNGNVNVFQFLRERGADYVAKDSQGRDALACAVLGVKPEMESYICSLPSV